MASLHVKTANIKKGDIARGTLTLRQCHAV